MQQRKRKYSVPASRLEEHGKEMKSSNPKYFLRMNRKNLKMHHQFTVRYSNHFVQIGILLLSRITYTELLISASQFSILHFAINAKKVSERQKK
mmetsp:Transcript_13154/g.23856  ORF Transcript_13154/g.23856 Transcript_13154/m.23856 type:complete len:94 (+) Transcript_13154:1283-1564(+)